MTWTLNRFAAFLSDATREPDPAIAAPAPRCSGDTNLAEANPNRANGNATEMGSVEQFARAGAFDVSRFFPALADQVQAVEAIFEFVAELAE